MCQRLQDGGCHLQGKESAPIYLSFQLYCLGCYVDNERFLPGHFIQGASNTIWLCYRGLDNVIRLRVRHRESAKMMGDD